MWFGRPCDNNHKIVNCFSEENTLTLEFDEQETLSLTEPDGLVLEEGVFFIQSAARVRWEWFYYGRPKTEDNRYFIDFVNQGTKFSISTNANWHCAGFHISLTEKAVEILCPPQHSQ